MTFDFVYYRIHALGGLVFLQKIMIKILIKTFFVLALLHLVSCDNAGEEAEKKSNTLVVATSADFPPFEFIQDRQIQGFDIDLVKTIAHKLGYQVYVRDITFHGLIPALKTGRADVVVAAITATPARSKDIDFSVAYYNPSFAMLFRKDGSVPEMDNLSNKVIGVQSGTTMEMIMKKRIKKHKFKIVSLPRTMHMVQDLKLGRLDGVLLEEAQAKELSDRNEAFDYYVYPDHEYGYSIAFQKGSKLRHEFNEILVDMRDNGELSELKKKWLF